MHLKQTIEYAKDLVGVLSQPAAIVDDRGIVLARNLGFANVLQCDAHETAGRTVRDIFGDFTKSDLGTIEFCRDKEVCFQAKLETSTGEYRLSIKPLPGPYDIDVFLCEVVPDFEVSSLRLNFLLDHLNQGIWDLDLQSMAFRASPAWMRMRGIDTDNPLHKPFETSETWWLDNVHPDDVDFVRNTFVGMIKGEVDTAEAHYRYADQHEGWRWIFARARIMSRAPDGQPLRLIGLDSDVTSFKQDEVNAHEIANKLQLAINVAGMGLWEFDAGKGQVHWDKQQLQIYGLADDAKELPHNVWETVLHPEDREEAVALADHAFKTRTEFRSDYRIVRPDGEVRYVRSAGRHVAVDGCDGKMIGVNLDVTKDYKRAEELERARQRLEYDSRHDALTGLANRRRLDDYIRELLLRLGPQDEFAVLHIDLDHFKQVNDTLGHAAGDQVLVRVAETLKAVVGDMGIVCRNGGDEFVVLVETFTGEAALKALCTDIIKKVGEPMVMMGGIRTIGLSIGGAVERGNVADPSEVFINADVALYSAKSAGRSCFRMFAPGMRTVTQADLTTYNELSDAIDRGEFTCFYQPQFEPVSRKIVGAEALVRWECPERGVMPPGEFLDMVNASGLLARMDDCVLDSVLAAQTRWAQAGLDVPIVALNVSMARLLEPELLEKLEKQLRPHHAISFELLETAFLDERSGVLEDVLAALRALDIRIDLDDFGSGHSSVVALQSIRPDRVKMDQMLIRPLEDRPAQYHVLDALVRVARLEGCEVVVEGVETDLQLDAVMALQCEVAQGYLLGRPVAEDEFATQLRELSPQDGRANAKRA